MFHIVLICSLSFAQKASSTVRKIFLDQSWVESAITFDSFYKKNVQQTQQEREIAHYPVIRSDLTDDHVSRVSPQSQLQTWSDFWDTLYRRGALMVPFPDAESSTQINLGNLARPETVCHSQNKLLSPREIISVLNMCGFNIKATFHFLEILPVNETNEERRYCQKYPLYLKIPLVITEYETPKSLL